MRSAAAISRSHSSSVGASGFSSRTSLPALQRGHARPRRAGRWAPRRPRRRRRAARQQLAVVEMNGASGKSPRGGRRGGLGAAGDGGERRARGLGDRARVVAAPEPVADQAEAEGAARGSALIPSARRPRGRAPRTLQQQHQQQGGRQAEQADGHHQREEDEVVGDQAGQSTTGSVIASGRLTTMSGIRSSCQEMMNMIAAHAARPGVARGSTIRQNAPKRVQPSMRAASSSSAGSDAK